MSIHDSATKRRRAAETIDAVERSGEPVSFLAIARRAGVSVSLLYGDYRQPDRHRPRAATPSPHPDSAEATARHRKEPPPSSTDSCTAAS